LHHQEARPAAQKTHQRAKRLAQVNVLAAGRRNHCAQLGIRQRAEESEHARQAPHQQDHTGRRQAARHRVGHQKNRRADYRADQDRRGVDQAELARQFRILHVW
jgi:hypothetical protein